MPLVSVVMATYNLHQREEVGVLDACARRGVGALVKKPLASGYLAGDSQASLRESLALALGHPGVSSAVVGTVSPINLRANVDCARSLLD